MRLPHAAAIGLAILAVCAPGCRSARVRPQPLATLEQEADSAFRAGNYARAVAYDTEILDRTGGHFRAFMHRGLSFQFSGQSGPALDDFRRAIEVKPDSALARLYRAGLNLRMGNIDAATSDVNACLRMGQASLAPYEQTVLLVLSGVIGAHKGKAEDALSAYQRAIAIGRKNPDVQTESVYRDALYNAAEVCYALGRFPMARKYMAEYGEAKEQVGLAVSEDEHYLLGLLAYLVGDFEASRKHFRNVSPEERTQVGKLLGDESFFSSLEP